MRSKQMREHTGILEGIVREAETIEHSTRFRLESKKDKEDYFCFMTMGDALWLPNGHYVDINFSGDYPLERVQLAPQVRERGKRIFKEPSGYPTALQHPLPIKPIYIEVFELRLYQREKGELLHVYEAPVRLG